MNKRKIVVLSVLTIFVIGMALASVGAVEAKTVTMPVKMNKYTTKHKGKYTIQTFKWKSYSSQEVDVFLNKNGKPVKNTKYKVKIHYKYKGKWRNSKWLKGNQAATYHKHHIYKSAKVDRVKVRF